MEDTPFGRYRLQKLLGRGGMGEVWQAHDTVADRLVALKLLPAQWAEDEMFQQRFQREAHAAASLNEPHIVPIHNYGEIDKRLYVEMRLIEGHDLHAVLNSGPLIPSRSVAIVDQIAMALDAVHQSGLVHRDVKPSNILIARYDFAYLIDFGIARAARETRLTSAGHVIGTMRYMAPERFRSQHADARSDVYALACVLAECLTGTAPFAGGDAEQQLMGHLTLPPPRPSHINAAVPSQFDAVIAKGMAKNPDTRYQTTLELSDAARAVLSSATDTGRGRQTHRPADPAASTGHMTMPATSPGESLTMNGTDADAEQASADDDSLARSDTSIDQLLHRAVSALGAHDPLAPALVNLAPHLGGAADDADELWGSDTGSGEIRRLTIVSAELADPTRLARQVEPETYRLLVRRYREQVRDIAERFDGHVGSASGSGILVVFGYPHAHEDDVYRAVHAGLEITHEVERLSEQARRRFGAPIFVRVGVHRGAVYLDDTQDDVYGLTGTVATQVSALAATNAVAVTHSVEPLVRDAFEMETMPPSTLDVDGDAISLFRVIGERIAEPDAQLGPLVGRDRELGRLEKSWSRARAATLTVSGVVFRGEAGIGKSRLAAAAGELVRRDAGRILELVGSPLHADVGYYPIRMLLERRCGITRSTPPERRLQLLRTEVEEQGLAPDAAIPLLAPVIGIDAARGYSPVQAAGHKLQALIAEALKRYVIACFGGESGLLLAEDAQWFDPSTLELLGALISDTAGRLLVVVTGREGSWMSNQWPAKVFDLLPLNDEQSDELALALNPAVGPEDCAAVRARCGGVPFYIEQVATGLASASEGDRASVPERLYEPLFARLLATANVVPVVAAAAIIGRHIDRALLIAVCPLSDDEVDDVIDELEDAKVLEPQGPNAWRFRHELLREAAEEMSPPSARRALHAKIADAMAHVAAGDPDWRQVAAHYEQADQHAEAAAAYQKASTDARRRGALEEARAYLTHALTQLENCPPGTERDRLEIGPRLGRFFLASATEGYQSPAVTIDLERCLQLIDGDLTEDQLFGTLFAVCSHYINKADLQRASQLAAALRAVAAERWQRWSPAIECIHGMISFFRGEYGSARTFFEAASAGFDDDGHNRDDLWFIPHDAITLAYAHLAIYHVLHGDLAAARCNINNATQRADELGFPSGPYNHVYAIDLDIWVHVEASQFERATVLIADMIEKAQRYGFDFWQAFGCTVQARVDAEKLLRAGDYDPEVLSAQVDTVTQYTDFWRSVGLYINQTHYDCIVGELLTAAGRSDEARARLDATLELAEQTGMHYYDAELLRARAHTHGDPDTKAADLGVAIQLARHQDAPLFELRSAIDDFVLRGEEARDVLTEAVDRFSADCVLPEVVQGRAALADSHQVDEVSHR